MRPSSNHPASVPDAPVGDSARAPGPFTAWTSTALWSRIVVGFAALCLVKLILLFSLRKQLFEIHWRVSDEAPTWLNSFAFYLFAILVGLNLSKLAARCMPAGVRVVRAYVQEGPELAHFETLNKAYIGENLRLAMISGLFNPLLTTLVGFSFLLVLWFGGVRLSQHKISLGSFVMFNTYMGTLVWPLIAMGWVANLMERGRASLGRVRGLLEERPKIAAPEQPRPIPSPLEGEIEFRNVSVHYGDRPALENVNMRIPADLNANLDAHTGDGSITLDVPIMVAGSLNHSSVHGKLNAGGGTLSITSGDGSIHLEKL